MYVQRIALGSVCNGSLLPDPVTNHDMRITHPATHVHGVSRRGLAKHM